MRKESSTNFENEQILKDYCSAFKTLSLISGRWKLSILFALLENKRTYSELKNILPMVSDRILSLRLNELQKDTLIVKDKAENKQSYTLSEKGFRLRIVLNTLSDWNKIE